MEYPSLNILKSFTTPRFIVEVILMCKSKYIFSNLTVSQNMKLIEEVCEILSDMKQYEYIRNIVSALNYKHYFNRETMLLKYVYLSPGISEVGLSDQEELQRTSFIQNCLRNSYSTFVDPSLIFKLFCFVRDSPRISDKKNLIDTLLKIKNFDTKLTVEQKVEIFETKQSSELFESIVCMQVPVDLRLRLLKTLNNPYFSINSEIFYDLFFSSIEVVEKITCVNVLGILMNTRSGQYCQELLFALYNLNFIKKIDKIKRLDYDDLVGQIILSKRFSIETTTDEMINYILYYSLISIPLSERTLTSEKYTDLVLKLSKVNSKDYTRIFRNPLYQNLPDWPKIISRDISLLDKLTINEKCCKYLIENKKLDLIQSKTFIISKFAFKDLENYFFDKSNYFEFHQFTESEIEPALSFLEITPKVTNSALKNLTLSRFIPMEISCFEYKNISAVQLSKIVENYLENNVQINRYLAGQIISKEIFFVGNKKYYFEKIDLFPFALQLLLKYIMNLQINFDKSIEIDQIHFCAFCQSNKSNGFVKTVLTKFKINNTSLVNGLGIAINDNNEELVKILIENFDIPKNCFCVDGKTIFHLCFAKDDKELIQYVSDHGFKQGFSDKGYIPKMLNFSMESNPNIKSLLKYPFVPLFTNIPNNSGYPSNQKFLVAYARTKNKSFIEPIWNSAKYPVQFHLFVSLFCNDFYYSFFDSELSNEDKEDLIDMLRTYPTEFMNNLFDIMNKTSEKLECDFYIELLYLAIYFGNVDFVDDVLYKMDLDSYDLRMISPICVAVKFDRFAIFKLMVSKKNEIQDVYFAPEDNFKYSKEVNLLEYVIKNERKAMFDLLIEKKFNVNAHGSFEPFLAAFNIFEQNGEKYYVQKLIPLLDIEFEKVKNPSVVSLIEFYKTGEKKFDGDTKYILDLLDSKVPKVLKNQRFVPKWLTKKVTENLKLRGNFN
ncbi:hypothetical protein TVAG_103240 [Trichomonas vaginalis G3]|uniref:DUF3447 domain-containing protein n=1 Tax=Trichomonas vaginalis (strain ATCC PRA-98 / G3) TaxID=412133 RepID=A2EKN5_TRIV3|nr:Ankyrin repeat family [Trichomonas vaginalis G3]EAY06774.1 hypothetical protein TVAG_103240 [Trichomonas vaginalis G3]KAI5485865.1 Ankyrin repeat family [Trichomonas vaginalis G3]|eukprot:XP_001318997.1 hypothetical protein [Trichomonas vaginalis G3]